jgi:hypothetical protein
VILPASLYVTGSEISAGGHRSEIEHDRAEAQAPLRRRRRRREESSSDKWRAAFESESLRRALSRARSRDKNIGQPDAP